MTEPGRLKSGPDCDALGAVPKPDAPGEMHCQECGAVDGLHADAGLVLCAECFDGAFPELERPPELEGQR